MFRNAKKNHSYACSANDMKQTDEERFQRFQLLFDQLTEGILFLDKTGRCMDANRAAITMTGYTQQELSQTTIADLIYSKDESEKFRNWLLESKTNAYQFESVWVAKSNQLIIIDFQVTRFWQPDIHLMRMKDVTDEKKTRAELESKSVLANAYFQSSTDSIFLLGRQTKIMGYNKVAGDFIQRIFRKSIEIGESILIYADINKRETFLKHYNNALAGIKFEKEIQINHPLLNTWWILRYEPIRNGSGEVIGVSFNGTDITERKVTEIELRNKISLIRQNEAMMSSIVNNTQLFIWSVDSEFKLLTINNALKEALDTIHHFQFEIGQRMVPLFSKELSTVTFIDQWIAYYQRALAGEAFKVTQWIDNVFYEFSLNPILENGKTIGVSVFAIDRTENIKHEEEVRNLNQQISELRLQALRSAMNPHFIFNAFNSIQYFVSRNDRVNAINYLSKFSKLVRGILSSANQKKIKLSEELSLIQNYIEIEQIRFENKFEYEVQIDDSILIDQIEIYPLLIQPYVENAILHGLYNKSGPGLLQIRLRPWPNGLEIEIEDNGIGREKAKTIRAQTFPLHPSMGMEITENRLKLMYQHSSSKHFEVLDLHDASGQPCGTRCILRIIA
jgi:PAS domain S-box-containing protein